ncbi:MULTISPECIES: hypothetical protein [Geobacillus]|uniref:Uncharacterized protein n=1 Tax=Geobacillus zalihae TaxID=213419 RepID=A0A7H1RVG9_9BACL|nr:MULTISPECIES: hypothetical protein [Geobacillus]ASS88243.1 hypothetical protein GLN3_15215 [Geobacillus lituanicus]OQP23862.1 hypothetical protein B1694_06940 [Geobacillus zalihae]QNU18258.1 hypothetical protein IC807_00720 [Geobacillus zalihae]
MNHWDPYMNGPFSTSSGHDNEAGWMENNVPPMAPLSATTPNEATPTQVMPMAYYPPATPYGYWCPPVAPPVPLVSPVHLDSPDSPDSSDMMLPAPPLGLGAGPNMAHASVWPMGGKENTPPMTPDDAAIPYGMTAPYAENVPPAGSTAPVAVPGTLSGMATGATPGFVPGAHPYAPLYYPPMAPQPYAPVMPYGYGYPAAPLPPYYGGGTPYAPGFPISYGPYR